jgi:hypothetical protein
MTLPADFAYSEWKNTRLRIFDFWDRFNQNGTILSEDQTYIDIFLWRGEF